MDKLPLNVLKRILDIVGDDGNDLLSLYFCSHVCVSWYNMIDFYANYVSADEDITRCKITSRKLKFYSESKFLSEMDLDDITATSFDALLSQCVMPSIGHQLLRVQCIDFPTLVSISCLIPQNLIDYQLSHIHLNNVTICNEIFESLCSKFAPTLSHLYVANRIEEGEYFSIAAVTQSISKLTNIRHLDLIDIFLNESSDNGENCGAFLESLAKNCPLIENLSINDYVALSNEILGSYLCSENTCHLRFLSVSSSKIDDEIEDAFIERMKMFHKKAEAPPLIIFTHDTNISMELCQKYVRPPYSFEFLSTDDEAKSRMKDGKLYLDSVPYGLSTEYPFQKSSVYDLPPSLCDSEYSTSGEGWGCSSDELDYDDYNYYDYDDEYDDDD